jgi:hypothetical protein
LLIEGWGRFAFNLRASLEGAGWLKLRVMIDWFAFNIELMIIFLLKGDSAFKLLDKLTPFTDSIDSYALLGASLDVISIDIFLNLGLQALFHSACLSLTLLFYSIKGNLSLLRSLYFLV